MRSPIVERNKHNPAERSISFPANKNLLSTFSMGSFSRWPSEVQIQDSCFHSIIKHMFVTALMIGIKTWSGVNREFKNRQSRTTCSYFCRREIKNINGFACTLTINVLGICRLLPTQSIRPERTINSRSPNATNHTWRYHLRICIPFTEFHKDYTTLTSSH